jgi:hypothetical protein
VTGLDVLPPWHRSCRADVLIAPDTIAGILDGDGSLTLVGRRGRQVPAVALAMRDDDPTPLAVARSLAAFVGRPLGGVYHHGGRHQWRAGSLADVAAVIGFLERHPLLSPRGVLQLAAIAEAAAILRSIRARRGARAPLTAAEAARLYQLRESIPGRGPVSEALALPATTEAADLRTLGAFFAGFAAAEACFETRTSATHHARPVFRLTQRVDNLALLEHFRDRLGIGRIAPVSVSVGSPAFQLIIEREDDVDALVALLRDHPLPETSPKAAQLDAWAELIALRRGVMTNGSRGDLGRSAAVAALVAELRAAKRYAGPRSLCACRAPEWARVLA